MILHSFKKIFSFIAALIILIVFFWAHDSIANGNSTKLNDLLKSLEISQPKNSQNSEENAIYIFKAFSEALESDDEETLALLSNWDKYLTSATHYSNDDYLNVIHQQQKEYYKVISAIGDSIGKTYNNRKKYSSTWIDDLTNHFGKEFVRKNRDAVLYSLEAILIADEDLEKISRDLAYKEAILFESYKDYFGMFISFYEEKLDGKAQKKMSLRKKTADTILEFVNNGNASATSMQATNTLKRILAENKARQLNEEIYIFLKSHPLSYTFSGIKALMDFDKAFGRP